MRKLKTHNNIEVNNFMIIYALYTKQAKLMGK